MRAAASAVLGSSQRAPPPETQKIFAHFELNLNRMVDLARSAGAEVVFITPVSNIASCSPFKSQPRAGLERDAAKRFGALMQAGTEASDAEDWQRATLLFEQAREIDDRYAELHYRLGLALFQIERYE